VEAAERSARRRLRTVFALKALALLAAVGLLAKAFARANWKLVLGILASVTPAALVLVLVPFAVGLVAECAAWRRLFGRSGGTSFARLLRVRVSTEPVNVAIPAGGLIAEVMGPLLLAPQPPLAASLAVATAKRWLTIRTHGLYVILGAAVAFGPLSLHSREIIGRAALPWVVGGAGLALVVVSLVVERAASRYGVAARLRGAVEIVRRSRWLRGRKRSPVDPAAFDRTDRELASLAASRHPLPTSLLLAQWVIDAFGSWLILRVLGAPIAFPIMLACDGALSVVRTLAIFTPSGLGVQDLGYLAFFAALGVPNAAAVGPAFVVLKRGRELFWFLVGFVFLFARRAPAQA
jgi:uncharacterized membrane protein YbhN (UPF0104 family)